MPTLSALPGAAFANRTLTIKTIRAGEVWHRMYETRFSDPLGWGSGLNRFSDPTGNAFGVVYLGASAKVTFIEVILRDRADGRDADFLLDWEEVERRSLASIEVSNELRLIDLTDDARLRMGVPSDVVGASDQTLARAWSAAFHAHVDVPDGVYYHSRLNGEPCIALYSRALRKLKTRDTLLLTKCEGELANILNDLEIAVA